MQYDKLIRIKAAAGCLLALTPEEYARAMTRGKQLMRHEQLMKRMARLEAKEARQAEAQAAPKVVIE
jgi:hypothetical protein